MFNVGFVSLLQYSRYSNELNIRCSTCTFIIKDISLKFKYSPKSAKLQLIFKNQTKYLQNVINTTGSNMYNINIKPYRILNSSGNKMQEK